MFGLCKRSCSFDPRFNREQNSHTSPISGDHRAVLPRGGGGLWMDRSRRCQWQWGGLTTAPLCGPRQRWPLIGACESLSLRLSQEIQLRQIYGTTTLHRPSCWHTPQPALRQAPPPPTLLLSVSLFVPCDLMKPCGRAAAERNAQNTQDRKERQNELGAVCPQTYLTGFFISPQVEQNHFLTYLLCYG